MTTAVIIKVDPKEPILHNPFYPKLVSSQALAVSDEQKMYINEILDIVCSDSQFKKKAIAGISYILNNGAAPIPIVNSLVPSSVALGMPSFDIRVIGTNFTEDSIIVFNGFDEPTTYISSSEVRTGVNMPLWQAPAVVPISVKNGEGNVSNSINFTFNAAARTATNVPGVEPHKAEIKTPELKPVNEPVKTPIFKPANEPSRPAVAAPEPMKVPPVIAKKPEEKK